MSKSMKISTATGVTLASVSAVQAACTQAHMNNRNWKVTAHEAVSGDLIFCKFRTSGAGTVSPNPAGCEYSRIGVNTDFVSPSILAVVSEFITMKPSDKCTYDVTLNLGDGSTVLKARLVLESSKMIANGSFLMGSGGGAISMMRQ